MLKMCCCTRLCGEGRDSSSQMFDGIVTDVCVVKFCVLLSFFSFMWGVLFCAWRRVTVAEGAKATMFCVCVVCVLPRTQCSAARLAFSDELFFVCEDFIHYIRSVRAAFICHHVDVKITRVVANPV